MLQMINVFSGYHKKNILKNVTLEISQNEILILIGLNGSGKSTLLKTLLGLLKPTKGEVLLNNKTLEKIPLHVRARWLSLVESQSRVLFSTSVSELLKIATRDLERDLSNEALSAVGLVGFENKNILELSSGETRRAFIAHGLVSNSKYILIDEPFAHLDWSHQNELLENLRLWKLKYNTTFVLAVHELDRAVQLADRMALIHQGQLLKINSVREVFSSPEIFETFAFQALIDENPIDGTRRLTLGKKK